MSMKLTATIFAATVCAAGSLAAQVPAQAQPKVPFPLAPGDCDWMMISNDIVINQDNGIAVHAVWDLTDQNGTAGYNRTSSGPLRGGIVKGTNKLDFTVDFSSTEGSFNSDDPLFTSHITNHYTGTINSDGRGASGTTVNNSGVSNGWTTAAGFTCVGRAPADSPPPLDSKVPVQVDKPPPAEPPPVEKPPTDAVRMLIARSGFNVTVHVTSTSSIPGHCTYTADEVNGAGPQATEEFDIAKRGSHEFTKLAPVLAQKYHVVLSCRGDFNGQNVEFGHQEQDVTAFG